MAVPLSSSGSSFIPTTKNLLCSFPRPPSAFAFSNRRLRRRLSICYSQFDGSAGDEAEAVDEPFFHIDDIVEDDSEEEDETESSIDLLIRFFQSMFKKVSKRAKKASRSVLPPAISPQLVSFAVDGTLLLALLSIIKAFLEVVCNLGGTVFFVILLLRLIWAATSYFQSSRSSFNQDESSYGTTQPAT